MADGPGVRCEACVRDGYVKVYLDGLLHLAVREGAIIAVQSWLEDDGAARKYCIEYTTPTTAVLSEYEDREVWASILVFLDTI